LVDPVSPVQLEDHQMVVEEADLHKARRALQFIRTVIEASQS